VILFARADLFSKYGEFSKTYNSRNFQPILFQAEKADLDNAEKLIGANKACPQNVHNFS
jgi:hypothetical protein